MPQITEQLDIVGLRFRMKKDAREVLAGLVAKRPLSVRFEREYDNKYHANAIQVIGIGGELDGTHLGYIRAATADLLAPLMDDGTADISSGKIIKLTAPKFEDGFMEVKIEQADEKDA